MLDQHIGSFLVYSSNEQAIEKRQHKNNNQLRRVIKKKL